LLLVTNKSKESIYCDFRVRIFKYGVLVEKPKGKRPRGRHRHKWRTILRWMLRKWDGGHGLDLSGSGQRQATDTGKCGNEPSDSIKCRDFHD